VGTKTRREDANKKKLTTFWAKIRENRKGVREAKERKKEKLMRDTQGCMKNRKHATSISRWDGRRWIKTAKKLKCGRTSATIGGSEIQKKHNVGEERRNGRSWRLPDQVWDLPPKSNDEKLGRSRNAAAGREDELAIKEEKEMLNRVAKETQTTGDKWLTGKNKQ